MRTEAAPAPSFLRHVSLLAGAAALGPLATLLAYPLLTRLYGPAAFGVLGLFEGVLAIALTVGTLRYHVAIPVVEDDADAAALLAVAIAGTSILSVVLAIIVAMVGDDIAAHLQTGVSSAILWLLPAATLAGGIALAFGAWCLRRREFARFAAGRVTQGLVQAAAQIVCGLAGVGAAGLALGLVAGRAVAIPVLARPADITSLRGYLTRDRIAAVVHLHRRLPLVSSWAAIVHVLGQQASILIVASWFGTGAAGLFGLAFFVTVGPAHLACQAIEQAFVARLRDLERDDGVPDAALTVFRGLVAIVVVPTMALSAVAPSLFALIFGTTWTPAGAYAAALAPSVAAAIIGAHLPGIVVLRHWQRAELGFNVALATARCTALWLGAAEGDPHLAVMAYGAASAVLTLTYSGGLLVAQGIPIGAVIRPIVGAVVVGTVIALPLAWLEERENIIAALVGAAIAIGWIVAVARRPQTFATQAR
jgi:lipopolysaccharide exporter